MLNQSRSARNCGRSIVCHVTVKPEQAMEQKLQDWKPPWRICQQQQYKGNQMANCITQSLKAAKKCLLSTRKFPTLKTSGQLLITLEHSRSNYLSSATSKKSVF